MQPDGARLVCDEVAVQGLTVRNIHRFDVPKTVQSLNCGRRFVPSGAGRLGITSTGGIAAYLYVARQLGKITRRGNLIPVRGPAQEESTTRLVHHNLEYPGHIPAVRDGIQKTRIKNLGLLLSHGIRATPI
jgi:hypothetical protein